MTTRKNKKAKKESEDANQTASDIPGQVSNEVNATYEQLPPKSNKKEIHSRQVLPPLKQGDDVPDENPSSSLKIDES